MIFFGKIPGLSEVKAKVSFNFSDSQFHLVCVTPLGVSGWNCAEHKLLISLI